MAPPLFDQFGKPVTLTRQVGRGGEGNVFEVQNAPNLVAKVYHHPPNEAKANKLRAMARQASQDLTRSIAWPTGVLQTPSGNVQGLLMPKVTGAMELHRLYNPVQRKLDFPNADFRSIVRACLNLTAAVGTVHDHGHVIGDVNQNNILVTDTMMIHMLDADSFQILDGSSWHLCEVGVGHFTPPELLDSGFAGVVRTTNHDAFGVAVLLFHLLYAGRHPFIGIYSGANKDALTIEKAILEFRFAYGSWAPQLQMQRPPHSLSLNTWSPGIAALFERAYSPAGVRGGRPQPSEWHQALQQLERSLVQCKAQTAHWYEGAHPRCPYCVLEADGGPALFIAVHRVAGIALFNLSAAWTAIEQVSPPVPVAPQSGVQSSPTPQALPGATWWRRSLSVLGVVVMGVSLLSALAGQPEALLVAVIGAIVWFWAQEPTAVRDERKRRKAAAEECERALRSLQDEWQRAATRGAEHFRQQRGRYDRARQEYAGLNGELQRSLATLNAQREQAQREHFLDRYYVNQAQLPGIGIGLKETLESHGITTARHVNASNLHRIHGFGPTRIGVLMSWKSRVLNGFRFDPTRPLDPADLARVHRAHQVKKNSLEVELSGGAVELTRLKAQVLAECHRLNQAIRSQAERLAQLIVDARA